MKLEKGDRVRARDGRRGVVDYSGKIVTSVWVDFEHQWFFTEELELLESFAESKVKALAEVNSIQKFRDNAERMKQTIMGE